VTFVLTSWNERRRRGSAEPLVVPALKDAT
jgi:hypothetical protein